jgi:DNA-binding NtrC family response regulator
MGVVKPRIFIVQENEDANIVLHGTMWLKGCEPHKFSNGKECLEKMSQLEGKVDAIIISGNMASDRNIMIITNIKKINNDTKILVIGDNDSDKTRILGYGADEFAQMPLSPENVADKTFMLISRDTIKQNRLT